MFFYCCFFNFSRIISFSICVPSLMMFIFESGRVSVTVVGISFIFSPDFLA